MVNKPWLQIINHVGKEMLESPRKGGKKKSGTGKFFAEEEEEENCTYNLQIYGKKQQSMWQSIHKLISKLKPERFAKRTGAVGILF